MIHNFQMSFSENHSVRDDFAIINIQEVPEEEENNLIQIHLSSGTAKISFHQFCKYSSLIQEELQNEANIMKILKRIEVNLKKYDIKDENVNIFFNILKETKVEITSNEYFDLYKLAEIFKVNSIKKLLKNYAKKFSQNLYFILNLMLQHKSEEFDDLFPNDYISDELENFLITNVEKCFTIELFGQLPISSIYRIIEKSDFNNISSDKLYDFIAKSIEKRHFLFHFLNINKLSDEKFDDLYQNYLSLSDSNKNYFDHLKNDLNFLKKLKENNKNLKKEVKQLKQMNNQLENQQNQIKIENRQLQTQLSRLQSNNQKLNDQVNELEKKIQLLKDQQNQMKIKNDNLQIQVNNVNRDKNMLKNQINRLTEENSRNLALKIKFEEENKKIIIKNNEFEKQINEMKKEKINDPKFIVDNIVFRKIVDEILLKIQDKVENKKCGIIK